MKDIKSIVNKVIGDISGKTKNEQTNIQDAWSRMIAGEELKHTKISRYSDGKLYINVDSSAWLYQFNLKRKSILEKMQQSIPEVSNIYFKIGKTI